MPLEIFKAPEDAQLAVTKLVQEQLPEENKQQPVDDKEVVEIMARGIEIKSDSIADLEFGISHSEAEQLTQAALKALADNGYIITRGNV